MLKTGRWADEVEEGEHWNTMKKKKLPNQMGKDCALDEANRQTQSQLINSKKTTKAGSHGLDALK